MANLFKGLSDTEKGDPTLGPSLGAKAQQVREYQAVYGAKTPATAPKDAPGTSKPAPQDKVTGRPTPKGYKTDLVDKMKQSDPNAMKPLGSFKKGGKVKKTGIYKLHSKERVLNAKQTKNLDGLAKGLKG
jgi:hypothetical protein